MSSAPMSSIMLLTIQHILQVVVHDLGQVRSPSSFRDSHEELESISITGLQKLKFCLSSMSHASH